MTDLVRRGRCGAGHLVLLALAVACAAPDRPGGSAEPPVENPGTLSVWAVNYPLAYFAKRVGGQHVAVSFSG